MAEDIDAQIMKPEQLPPTPSDGVHTERNEPAQGKPRRFTRRAAIIGTGATVAAAGLDALAGKWELFGGSKLIIPEYVHAIEGNEEEVKLNGKVIGRHFTQTGDKVSVGFAVADNGQGQFWSAFQRLGGVEKLGYPISWPLPSPDGFSTIQMFQGAVLQVNTAEAAKQGGKDGIVLFNACDQEGLSGIERNNPLFAAQLNNEGVPAHKPGGFSAEDRLKWLEPDTYLNPQDKAAAARLKAEYFNRGGPAILGYPTSMLDNRGLFTGLRFQRGILQLWNLKLPDHPELPDIDTITSFLVGDLLKRGNWVPQAAKVSLNPSRYASGGGNENGTGTEIFAPVSKDIITLDGKAKYHVIGDGIKLTLSEPVLYDEIFGPLVEKYRGNGLDVFLYTKKIAPNSIGWMDSAGYLSLQNRLQNYQSEIIYFGGFTNSFLGDTTVASGIRRTDGVAEIHLGLFPKEGANPTTEDIREHSFMLNGTLAQLIVKIPFEGGNSDLRTARLALVERRVGGNILPFPFTVNPA